MQTRSPDCRVSPTRGFTLIELLVTVTIVSVLAALVVPALTGALGKAKATSAVSGLRSVGIGIANYASDNELSLPGPLYTTISSRYRTGDVNQLATVVAPYMGYSPTNQWQAMPELLPQNWSASPEEAATRQVSTFISNVNDYDPEDVTKRPFGYPGSESYSATPLRMTQISQPDSLWLVKENPSSTSNGQGVYAAGQKRMFLFASGRVSLEDAGFSTRDNL